MPGNGKAGKRIVSLDQFKREHTRHRRKETYNVYIHKVLKQVHPDKRISKQTMQIINDMVGNTFDRLATAAGILAKKVDKQTLTASEIQNAVRLVFPGELAKHAISEGTKAISKFIQNSPAKVVKPMNKNKNKDKQKKE